MLEWHIAGGRVRRRGRDRRRGLDRQDRRRGPGARQRRRSPRSSSPPDETIEVGQALAELDPSAAAVRATAPAPTDGEPRAGAEGSRPSRTGEGDADLRRRRTPPTSAPAADATREPSTPAEADGAGGRWRSRCPRWASRSPRARSSSGTTRRATRSRRATPSSRSRPTRSTPRSPRPRAARSPRSWSQPDETVQVGQALAEMTAGAAPPAARRRAATAGGRRPRPRGAERRTAADGDGERHPVARRIAAANGVDLSAVQGSGPGGKVTKADVLAAATATAARRRGAGGGRRRRGEAAARPRRDARQGDEREPLDPDGDLVPHARRRHPRRQAQGAQRGAQGARHEGLVHAPDRLGDRQGRAGVAGDGPRLRGARRQAAA